MHLILSLLGNSSYSNVIRMILHSVLQQLQFPTSVNILIEVALHLTLVFLLLSMHWNFFCSSWDLSYMKNHSTKWMMQLKSLMQPLAPFYFSHIKPDKSYCLVSTGLGLPPGFHYSGLNRPPHFILLLYTYKQRTFQV